MSHVARLLTAAAATSCLLASPAIAGAAPAPHGPDPTVASVIAPGPYKVERRVLTNAATPGFGAATISSPVGAPGERFGAVAVSPGFTAGQATIGWYGPALASQGFVVITFDTNTRFDFPASRGTQLLAALDYVKSSSAVADEVDPSRLAVVGHSMGGGGTLEAAKRRPTLRAAIGLAPWNGDKTWPEIKTPTMIIAGENDGTASFAGHAQPFYRSLPATTPAALINLAGADHLTPLRSNDAIKGSILPWLKRFVDEDRRYQPLLCPGLAVVAPSALVSSTNNCSRW